MLDIISGKTNIYGIIGHPVTHSLSPLMQNAAIKACQLESVYVPFDVKPENLQDAVNGLRCLGIRGFNVTIPHKTDIIQYLDCLDPSADAAGAVNTVLNSNGHLTGFNTDGNGLLKSLAEDLDFIPENSTVVMIGAGGAARGAVAALCCNGAKKIVIINRTIKKAHELSNIFSKNYPSTVFECCSPDEGVTEFMFSADLLLNCSSVGMKNESFPYLDFTGVSKDLKVYDMIYSPQFTPLLIEAAKNNFRFSNGLGMLAGQGELAFEIWNGFLPPLGLMKKTLASICIA